MNGGREYISIDCYRLLGSEWENQNGLDIIIIIHWVVKPPMPIIINQQWKLLIWFLKRKVHGKSKDTQRHMFLAFCPPSRLIQIWETVILTWWGHFSRAIALRLEIDLAESGHLRSLAATCLELAGAATCGHLLEIPERPLASTCLELSGAATCGHSSGWKWLQVAAMHLLQRPLAAACSGGHLQPIEWLQVAASGCEWLHAGRKW